MGFKEQMKKVNIYIHIEEKLRAKNLEFKKTIEKLNKKKDKLKNIEQKISSKIIVLEFLKTEIKELKNFINLKFKEEFPKYDYELDITNCYIISIHVKKYITLKTNNTTKSKWYTLATGFYNIKTYEYYDVLDVKDKKYKYLCEYTYGYFDNDPHSKFSKIVGQKPEYEKHILEVYPELSIFLNNKVPNTYLQKIYYEINKLGNKKLIK